MQPPSETGPSRPEAAQAGPDAGTGPWWTSPAAGRTGLVVARVGAALALALAVWAVLRPFLVAITWAAIVAYVTWPLHRRLRARVRHERLAAALFTAGVAVVAGLPVAWFLVALAREATELVEALRGWLSQGSPVPAWVTATPWLAGPLELLRAALPEPLSLAQWLVRHGARVSSNLVEIAGGIARNAITFVFTFVTLYVFYLDGERLLVSGRRLVRTLFPYAPARFVDGIGATVRAVVFGLLGTGLVQGLLAGAAFAVAGVPSPVALGALTALLSLVPAGPTVVGAGAVLWLILQGHPGAAIGLGLWVLLVVASVDNVLRPLLISGSTRIPFLLVLFGVLGGLATFGMLGVFLGPVLLSVAFVLLAELVREESPEPRAAG